VAVNPRTHVPPLGIVSDVERRGLYWATAGFDYPVTAEQIIQPRGFVAGALLYNQVTASLDGNHLAKLDKRRADYAQQPSLEKCVAEAIYERVRQQVLPDAPSRLRCLWAALDGLAAIQFASAALGPPTFDLSGFGNIAAVPVSTADGRWVAVDMRLFAIPMNISSDVSANSEVMEQVELLAQRYWKGEESDAPFIEVLAEKLWKWTALLPEYVARGQPLPSYREFARPPSS
jgi:hypothetical protein